MAGERSLGSSHRNVRARRDFEGLFDIIALHFPDEEMGFREVESL